jgi:hypothetical protein
MGKDQNISQVKDSNSLSDGDLEKIKEFVKTISYGSVTLIIQDGKLIQLEKNEKVRLK